MADPVTTTTTAATVTPYITAFATIAAPTITALSLNYATQNKRAERTKALIENKIALDEKGASDPTTAEIRAMLNELILLTLQTDINKSVKLTWKQIFLRVGITAVLILIVAAIALLILYSDFFREAPYAVLVIGSALGFGVTMLWEMLNNRSSTQQHIEVKDNNNGTITLTTFEPGEKRRNRR